MKINVWSYEEEYKSIRKQILKETEKLSQQIFSLPMYPQLKKSTVSKIVKCLKGIV